MPYPEPIREMLLQIWRSPDPSVLKQLCEIPFVAHNIPLSENIRTRPEVDELISDSPRTKAIHDSLQRFIKPDLLGKSALDLGCLEGGQSFELRRAGLNVLGVEGRDENYQKCLLIKEYFKNLGGLNFLLCDVHDFEPQTTFDFVLCSGLLYHLDDAASFIGKLGRWTSPGGMLFLDTHVAPEDSDFGQSAFRDALSEIKTVCIDGLEVRYREYQEDVRNLEASIGNNFSMWMDVPSHLELLFRAGFGHVFELHGYFSLGEQALKRKYSRRYFVAIKEPI